MIDYRSSAIPYVGFSQTKGSSQFRSRAIRAGVIYGGAGGIGYLCGGPAGTLVGIAMVPEIVAIPIILA
jgi:hypothetical protein